MADSETADLKTESQEKTDIVKPDGNNDNDDDDGKSADTPASPATNQRKCPPFGVRSYLNQFYNLKSSNAGTIFEDPAEEYALLLKPKKNGNKYCRPILWKAAIWIGINFLIFGMIGIMVAYLVPKRIVFMPNEQHQYIVNEQARIFNHNLEIVKLVGLLFFCLGGILTVIGLLVPTLLWKHCFDAQRLAEPSDYGGNSDKSKVKRLSSSEPSVKVPNNLAASDVVSNIKLNKVQPESNSK